MLLPFAALGWIVGATYLATRDPDRVPWRWPAVIALVVFTVGAVNATALIMIVPAPALTLLIARRSARCSWLRLGAVAALTATMCTAVSLWWIAMAAVQRANGADVLAYSESLRAVASTSTAVEVTRGLGYWLFYVRDHVGATTTASIDHLDSPAVIAAGFLVVLLALLGIVLDRGAADDRRRLAAWCVAVGAVVAVGVYPIDDPSPIVRLIGGDLDAGAALALRSTARAVPVLLFGLALGAALLVEQAPWPTAVRRRLRGRAHHATAAAVVAAALVATPSWWTAALVDPNLDREPDPPAAWRDGAAFVERSQSDGRVLQLPGSEFGAFEWGVTVDQPLPSLIDRAVVTRDLLPLGSPAAMDLVFALDDRLQEGTFEPGSLAPVSRWLGVSHVWVAGDLDVERYDTARPGVLADALARHPVGDVEPFGAPRRPVHVRDRSMLDDEQLGVAAARRAIAPVTVPLWTIRARWCGSGPTRSSSSDRVTARSMRLPPVYSTVTRCCRRGRRSRRPAQRRPDRGSPTRTATGPRHWRSSQDVHGFHRARGIRRRPAASRPRRRTAPGLRRGRGGADRCDGPNRPRQFGPVTARATAYGQPFAHLPEHRPAMAIDGDPTTSWTVGEHADPVGERIEFVLDPEAGPGRCDHRPPAHATRRSHDHRRAPRRLGAPARQVVLDARSTGAGGQRITVDVPAGGTSR